MPKRPTAATNPPPVRSAQVAARASATRQALVTAARRLFVEKGYFDTGTEEIVREANVTRGALYHHFADKKALFLAVFEAVENDLLASAAETARPVDALDRLQMALLGFLDASLTPEVQRVLLIDGPAVLGWQEWRALEARYGLGIIRQLLADAIDEGALAPQSVDALAHILLAAVDEAALFIANAPKPHAARDAAANAMRSILAGLTGKPPG